MEKILSAIYRGESKLVLEKRSVAPRLIDKTRVPGGAPNVFALERTRIELFEQIIRLYQQASSQRQSKG
jgi:hypothetical protein